MIVCLVLVGDPNLYNDLSCYPQREELPPVWFLVDMDVFNAVRLVARSL